MQIAILGATSEIAKDLIYSFSQHSNHQLTLYARRPQAVLDWLLGIGLVNKFTVKYLDEFSESYYFDALINFVGVGNPAQALLMGSSILDITYKYDEIALKYLQKHTKCRYIFLSSGAAYGASFNEPANEKTASIIPINHLQEQDWYGIAKLYTECRHRALPGHAIVDIRLFNYFSHTQNMDARFLMADIVRAIRAGSTLKTSDEYIVRDYIGADDFYNLIVSILNTDPRNSVVDTYSRSPIDKPSLLKIMIDRYGLRHEVYKNLKKVDATGAKPYYFSLNHRAQEFDYFPEFSSEEVITNAFDNLVKK